MTATRWHFTSDTDAYFVLTSADIKADRVCAETLRSAIKQRAGSLRGYSSSTMQKSLADDSEWEIDGGENTRGKGAAEHCFPPAFRQGEHVRPPCVNSMSARGYDRSSDRDAELL